MKALITGVTGNVGRACQRLIDKEGWSVIGVSRNNEYGPASFDLSNTRSVRALADLIEPQDLVIMAHGTQHGVEVGQDDFLSWYKSVGEHNLDSAVYLTDALIRYDLLNDNALIIYCSSIQATQPRAGRGAYAVAKAGLEALAKTVAVEQAHRGIRAVALRLGQLDSLMKGVEIPPDQMKTITDRLPLPLVPCDEVARLCLDLYELKSLSGEIINFDSAHRLNIWP